MAINKDVYKDHNILAHKGYTDEYMLKDSGGPAKLAGTPRVNSWMINNEFRENKKSGMSIKECNELRSAAQRTVAEVKRQRGY
tara:strand:+ start:5313 stop:5561 length:249 start_codon:yes stop_codon:yes gene_type:complete